MAVTKAKPSYKLVTTNLRHHEKIPQDWDLIPLKNLIQEIKTGFAEGERDENGVTQLRMNNISDDGTLNFKKTLKVPVPEDISEYDLRKNDILFNNTNSLDLIGKTTIIPEKLDYTFSNHITRIRTNEKLIPYFLLLMFLKYKRNALFRSICNTHVGQSGIGKNELLKVRIIYPQIKEQQKIASILSNVDSLISSYDEIIQKTKVLKKGLMQQLLTKGIRHKKFKKVKSLFGKYIQIPYSWDWNNITNVFEIKSGTTPSRTIPEYFSGDIPWITSTDLNRSVVNDTLEKITKEAAKKSRLKLFLKGTFVIAIYGLEAAGTRGKCGILGQDSTINQACMAFIDGKNVLSLFLFYYYLAFGEKIALNLSQGTKQQNLSEDVIKFLKIPIPSLVEQQKIVSILSEVDTRVNNLKHDKSNLEILKKGLMQKLLTGEIRV